MPKATQLIQDINNGNFDKTFAVLYDANDAVIQAQRQRYIESIQAFEKEYGGGRELSIYSVPGRTEIGGNHTDHNNGLVMAAAVNLDIIAVVAKSNDQIVKVKSKGYTPDSVDLAYLTPVNLEFGKSSSLIRGVAAGIKQRGGAIGGFEAYTTSDVLQGSGLSSSAAFEVCIATIFNHLYNQERFTPVELGMISQFAENVFFGKPSGLMDQTACAVGSAITIDFATPGEPIVQKVPFNLEQFGYRLVITDTKGSHADLTDDYAAIRQEMESVAGYFGKAVLREVEAAQLMQNLGAVRKVTGDRALLRAIHFFEECRRVGALTTAIEASDFNSFKELIIESGNSSFEYNQNAYSIKAPKEQGVALGLAISQLILQGKGAWRLQGGGFAGTIQAFVPKDMLQEYCQALTNVFGSDACHVLSVRSVGCTAVLQG